MSKFGENHSRCLSNFLETHIFWKFDHISKTYNQINNRNIWFAKVIIILIMTAQVLFSIFFLKKTCTLMPLGPFASWDIGQHVYCNCLFPRDDILNFEINLIFLIKLIFYLTKKSRQKFKYLENKKSFQGEIKTIFHHF